MNKRYLYGILVIAIITVAGSLIYLNSQGKSNSSGNAAYDDLPVPQSLLSQLSISTNVANTNNVTQLQNQRVISSAPHSINASPLTQDGKPLVLYIGAEYCPYCGAERWAMIIALQRFGNFTGLKYMTSSASDNPPSVPTFTFYNSTYTSQYITFVAVETTTNKFVNGTYPTLQTPTAFQTAIFGHFNPSGSIPFIDIANHSIQIGSNYDPGTVFAGQNWTSVATAIGNPSTYQSKAIVGGANLLTAQICEADGNQPASVCSQQYVTALEKP